MTTVSARPDNLSAYRSKLEGADRELRSAAGGLLHTLQEYRARSPEFGADHTELALALGKHATVMEQLDGWVGRIGEAFRQADRAPGPAPVGVMLTTDESKITAEALDKAFWEIAHSQDPQRVHDWWTNLTQQERDAIAAAHPGMIGNLDGIPCKDRDRLNRDFIALRKKQLQDALAARQGVPSYAHDENFQKETRRLKNELDKIDQIDKLPKVSADGLAPMLLLGINPDGPQGRAIVSVGDPDLAKNVVTLVPGAQQTLADIGVDVHRADLMRQSADKASGQPSTAAIAWLGYDTPPAISDGTSASYADAAAKPLANFATGLGVTHLGPPAHTTMVGHSYGSLVLGKAMINAGMRPNDIIFVGSLGVGVDHAKDLGIPPGNVWAGASPFDPLTGLPVHGNLPHSGQFGGRTFNVPWGGHSGYWDQSSESLNNMGRIIAQRYDQVTNPPSPSSADYPVFPVPTT